MGILQNPMKGFGHIRVEAEWKQDGQKRQAQEKTKDKTRQNEAQDKTKKKIGQRCA